MFEMAMGVLLALLYFSVVVWAGLLWGAIWLLERDNPYNKFHHALIYAAIRIVVDIAFAFLGIFGIAFVVAYFAVAVRLLVFHYEMALWKAVCVIGLVIATPFVVMPELADWIGGSLLRLGIVLVGLPTGIIAIWLTSLFRTRYNRAKHIPEARIVTRAVSAPPVPPAPVVTAPIARAKPAPEPPPPDTRTSQPLVPLRSSKPEIEIPAAPSEGPRFLR
jgi:hypothetical protein